MELPKTLIYVYELSMDNKFVLGVCIIGFGILLLLTYTILVCLSSGELRWFCLITLHL